MSTNFVSTIVYEEEKIFKWLLKEQRRLVQQCKEQRDSYYLIGSLEEYKEKANHLDNQVELEEILDFLCDAKSNDDQYFHGQSEEHHKDILQIIRETIYSIQEEQKELLSYANLRLERLENRFEVYVHEYIIKDDDKNEDKTISMEKESEQKILPDDNQCSNDVESCSTANADNPEKELVFNSIEEKKEQESLVHDDPSTIDIENNSTANANNPEKEPVFNSIEEKKEQESLVHDDPSTIDIENNSTANANNPEKEPALNSIEEKKEQESLVHDDSSTIEIANDCEARDEKPGVELDIEMALLISELEEGIDKQQMRTLERGFERMVHSIEQYRLGLYIPGTANSSKAGR